MPLIEATLAQAMMKSYDNFKSEMKNSGGNNNETNGNSDASSGNSSNRPGVGSNNSQEGGNSSQSSGSNSGNGEQGNQGGNGSSSGRHPNEREVEPYVNPNCPVHGVKKPKKCPVCGHTDCNCKFHKPDKKPEEPFGFNGNEINPDNIDDLKKQCEEEDKKFDDAMNNNGGDGSGNGNGLGAGMMMSGAFLKSLSKAIDDELQKATPTMTNLSILTARGTLYIKPKSNFILYAVEIATKVMAYWTLCIAPIGIPVSGVITTVIPMNQPTLIAPMAQEILMSALQAAPGGNYQKLAEIICAYSRQALWQVIEVVPGSPPVTIPYTVQIQ